MDNAKKYLYLLFLGISLIIGIYSIVDYNNGQDYRESDGRIIIIFNQEMNENYIKKFMSSLNISADIKNYNDDYALLQVMDERHYGKILKSLQSNKQIRAVQPDYSVKLTSTNYGINVATHWTLDNRRYEKYVSQSEINTIISTKNIDSDVAGAWKKIDEIGMPEREVVVAVIDTGVDYMHPDLVDNMWINRGELPDDGIDNDHNGYIDDVYGWDFYNKDNTVCHYSKDDKGNIKEDSKDNDNHATHVAGIIGAVDNNIGISGVASKIRIKLMSLKINGGTFSTGKISSAIEAIKYADKMGASICNISWELDKNDVALSAVIKESDMLFVTAAGNDGNDNDVYPMYPASLNYNNIISVAFTNASGKLDWISNYGVNSVDIAAPGEDIYSTVIGGYAYMSGSSMSVPYVSGIAALLYAYGEKVYPANIKDIILKSVKEDKELIGYIKYPGEASAYNAVLMCSKILEDFVPPNIHLNFLYQKDKIRINAIATDKGNSGIRSLKWMFGKKTIEDFEKGMSGLQVDGNQIIVSKEGVYTFYASDYSGNEIIKTINVLADKTKPIISYELNIKSDKSGIVTINAKDSKSGIKTVEYLKGKRNVDDFHMLNNCTKIEIKHGKGYFVADPNSTYTIFAEDFCGNTTITYIST